MVYSDTCELGATRLVHWLILVAPSCLMLKSLNNTIYIYITHTTSHYMNCSWYFCKINNMNITAACFNSFQNPHFSCMHWATSGTEWAFDIPIAPWKTSPTIHKWVNYFFWRSCWPLFADLGEGHGSAINICRGCTNQWDWGDSLWNNAIWDYFNAHMILIWLANKCSVIDT